MLVVSVAIPPASGTVLRAFAPSKKVTVPVGVPTVEVTVAVNVIGSATPAGLLSDVRAIVGVAWVTSRVPVFKLTL